jgi:hypothetical protein
MKRILVVCALMVSIAACKGKSPSTQGNSVAPPLAEVTVEKERAEKEEPLPAEVRIKLKKDGKDNYSWELSGSDVDQILKVNEKLRKQLGGGQPQ